MRKLLVFQHVPFEPLGTLDRRFKEAGFRIRYVNFHRDGDAQLQVERYHGLVVLGGPMSADQFDRFAHLAIEQDAIRRAIGLSMPVLGICLGAQLMAASLGGRTLRGTAVEYGWTPVESTSDGRADPLFRHFEGEERIFQWHSDTFTLPFGAVHLASSPSCRYQAFRVGDCAYGLQFHLEADEALISRWLASRRASPELGGVAAAIDADETMRETSSYMPRASKLAGNVFDTFIEQFFSVRRRRAQPSR
jgi:GMP synthase (glutamine-hydrolysing)